MADLRCWQCGVEPLDVIESRRLNGTVDVLPGQWPPGDHQHAVEPPTPGQLLAEGAAITDRIMKEWGS